MKKAKAPKYMNKYRKKDKDVPSYIYSAIICVALTVFLFFRFSIALNLHNPRIWVIASIGSFLFVYIAHLFQGRRDFWFDKGYKEKKGKEVLYRHFNVPIKSYIAPLVLIGITLIIALSGSKLINAEKYAAIMNVTDAEFSSDIAESVGTDSIALMDTASARMLGDREIGSLSSVVSQFNVSDDYIQIDYLGKPVKVSALNYTDFFKWKNNRKDGIKGYVMVDPVSMSASFNASEGMKYVPSAYFFDNAYRHIWLKYPTLMFENLHFEIDEDGKPYYVAAIMKRTVSLFGGKTVSGCVVLDPVTGEITRYDLADVPKWVDVVFDGDLICEQYNWFGTLQGGYFNSLFGRKGCKRVTTYNSNGDSEDETPSVDYGYVAKDGDILIYTGVTSLNGDSSNIGFLLANERTGESRYYTVAGADEKSAMAAAEGEVQEKGYQASFPSLINVDGNPTYIMVLKDSGGLVKLYAAVNVEQYNLVTTAATQSECIKKYRTLIGSGGVNVDSTEEQTVTAVIADIKYIVIDGNTYIYLIDKEERMFRAKASEQEDMLLLKVGDTVELTCSGRYIVSCTKK